MLFNANGGLAKKGRTGERSLITADFSSSRQLKRSDPHLSTMCAISAKWPE